MADLGGGTFEMLQADNFSPQYGGVNWKPRLNNKLEETDTQLQPIGYREGDNPLMQITQENAMVFLNAFVDELDAIAIMYEYDPDNMATWYFREKLDASAEGGFNRVAGLVGQWATATSTLYPMSNVVDIYESLHAQKIPDGIPEDFA